MKISSESRETIGFRQDDAKDYYRQIARGRKHLNPLEALVLLDLYMQKFGLDGWTAGLDASRAEIDERRARSGSGPATLGYCINPEKRICLTSYAVQHLSPAQVKDAILHECAHALVDEEGHGPEWIRKALELGARPVPIWEPSLKSQEREWVKREVREVLKIARGLEAKRPVRGH